MDCQVQREVRCTIRLHLHLWKKEGKLSLKHDWEAICSLSSCILEKEKKLRYQCHCHITVNIGIGTNCHFEGVFYNKIKSYPSETSAIVYEAVT
jgi:hypothetical protein